MNWKDLLEKSAYWSKWLLLSFCISHTYFDLPNLPTTSVVLVVATTAIITTSWVRKQRKQVYAGYTKKSNSLEDSLYADSSRPFLPFLGRNNKNNSNGDSFCGHDDYCTLFL